MNRFTYLHVPIWAFALILMALPGIALTQSIELDLGKVRNLALKNNPDVKLAQKAIEKSGRQIQESRGGLLPTVSAFANYKRAWELPTVYFDNPNGPGKISFKMGSEHTFISGLNFQQPLFLGGAAWNGYQLSRLGKTMAELQANTTRESVLLNATSAYFSLLFARSSVSVMESALQTAKENLKQVQEFKAAGKSSDFDVLRAEVQVATYQPQVISARNNVRLAESQLRMVTGLDQNTELVIHDKLSYKPNSLVSRNVDDLYRMALERRPEVNMIYLRKTMAEKQLNLVQAAQSPALVFNTAYQYQGERQDFNFSKDDFFKSFNSSIGINIPLFNGLQTRAKIQQARISIRETDDQKEALLRGIRMEVEAAYFTAEEAEQKVIAQTKLVEQAREAFRLAKLRYREGASTQLEVMNAELLLNQAQMTFQQSLFEYNLALAGLEKAINQL
ncbi:MAG: TolC family protein [FCB group bacterium]|nr:TolC family protein [FCB group bacterium]